MVQTWLESESCASALADKDVRIIRRFSHTYIYNKMGAIIEEHNGLDDSIIKYRYAQRKLLDKKLEGDMKPIWSYFYNSREELVKITYHRFSESRIYYLSEGLLDSAVFADQALSWVRRYKYRFIYYNN